MAIVLTDEMMDLLQGMDGVAAKAFLQGVRMAQAGVAEMAKAPSAPIAAPSPAPTPPESLGTAAPQPKPLMGSTSYRNNRGAQAEVLRALFTGPASYTQLQETLRFERLVVVRVLSQLQRQGDATNIKSGTGQDIWQLTPQGRHVAAVFVNNPGLKVLNTQVRQRLANSGKSGG